MKNEIFRLLVLSQPRNVRASQRLVAVAVKGGSPMTWKVEKVVRGEANAFSLSGRVHADHLDKLKAVLGGEPANTSLDLKEVTIVDVDVVRFLGDLERTGVCLLHCSPYIRAWIDKECGKG